MFDATFLDVDLRFLRLLKMKYRPTVTAIRNMTMATPTIAGTIGDTLAPNPPVKGNLLKYAIEILLNCYNSDENGYYTSQRIIQR